MHVTRQFCLSKPDPFQPQILLAYGPVRKSQSVMAVQTDSYLVNFAAGCGIGN